MEATALDQEELQHLVTVGQVSIRTVPGQPQHRLVSAAITPAAAADALRLPTEPAVQVVEAMAPQQTTKPETAQQIPVPVAEAAIKTVWAQTQVDLAQADQESSLFDTRDHRSEADVAHWAEINSDNIVIRVLVGSNDEPDEGYKWLIDNLGGTWIKTSYNTRGGEHINGGEPLRKNYAGPGFKYDVTRDAFIPPKPFDSWLLNENTCLWEAPVAYPNDGAIYRWDEDTLKWIEVTT